MSAGRGVDPGGDPLGGSAVGPPGHVRCSLCDTWVPAGVRRCPECGLWRGSHRHPAERSLLLLVGGAFAAIYALGLLVVVLGAA